MGHKPHTKDYTNWYGNPSPPPLAVQKFEHVNAPSKGRVDALLQYTATYFAVSAISNDKAELPVFIHSLAQLMQYSVTVEMLQGSQKSAWGN
jgi:hypothetical protein